MSVAIRSPLLALAPEERAPAAPVGAQLSALEWVLADQQTLTAVDRFSKKHADLPANARLYRDLIPASSPGPGQQYAFDVDLDLCTGCKACVTGCHNLNGLDDGEVWRTVGLLHGGTHKAPSQQTVTTACHHCLDPACMNGCPVKSYDKDPVTGIVKHLDDQCIGCQYCIFMCPYDAPKYNKARGIVRKCDMCSDRLAHGEAPACVQSCPNEAIRITVVDREEAIQATEANAFLPGAPAPSDTLPTTVYHTERVLPRNMLPADFYSVHPEHAHLPLVAMLGLTQLSVGAFILNLLVHAIMGPLGDRRMEIANAVVSLALGMAALGAATLHLGRPKYAFRAFLGLKTSWMSREIIVFSKFAGLSLAYAAAFFVPQVSPGVRSAIGYATGVAGILGVYCSVMIYAVTKRPHWKGSVTGFKFSFTTVVLGAATVLMISAGTMMVLRDGSTGTPAFVSTGAFKIMTVILLLSAVVKLISDASVLLHLRDTHHSGLKRAALLMAGDLSVFTKARFICGILGGLVLPALGLVVVRASTTDGAPFPYVPLTVIATGAFALSLVAELIERMLFFAAAPSSKMPGGIN
ncbi:MAG TPA: DmsC/YnfH family molybdoenzyme membrane anchor subunit [Polyangia bacterium]|nr:DmsC/YnfH family molybdoenzyme membrane anchor subunit [Polyangia bacterium]